MLFPIAMIVFGALAVRLGLRLRAESNEKSKWPTAPGQLVKREIKPDTSTSHAQNGYVPDIEFSYTVDGKPFVGRQMFSRAGESYDVSTMRKKVDALPAAPEVHYNPKDPGDAFLVVTAKWWVWLSVGFGVVMILLGAMIALGRSSSSSS
jgi:hypothetical protein